MCIWKVAAEDRRCEFCTFVGGCEERSYVDTREYKSSRVLEIMNELIGVDVRDRSQKSKCVWGRNMVAYKLSSYGFSLSQIGKVIKRDHATSLHGIRRFETAMKYHSMYQDVMEIWNSFKDRLNLEKL